MLTNKEYLKEKFIHTYCKKRGWDPKNLTQSQMKLIVMSIDYKNIK